MKNKLMLYKKLIKVIKEHNTIYLFRHQNPDPDALGSVFGLKEIIKGNFKNKKIFIMGEKSLGLEHLFPTPNKVSKITKSKTLAIIADTANTSRIDSNLWRDCDYVVKIDHHPEFDKYGDLSLVDSSSIAACEIIVDWAVTQKLNISKKAAKYLYTGILTDSGRFLFPNTSAQTLSNASKLLSTGFDKDALHTTLYTKTLNHGKFQSFVLMNAEIKDKVGYIYITPAILHTFKMSVEDAKLYVNTLAGFSEIDIWALAVKDGDIIRVSVRSKKQYAINKIAAKFDGGGHKNASGAKVKSKTIFLKFISALRKITK